MKVRIGFVSNSSSSSFVVVSDGILDQETEDAFIESIRKKHVKFVPFQNGAECKFGWEEKEYNDVDTKLNWAFLQAYYAKKQMANEKPLALLRLLFKCHRIDIDECALDKAVDSDLAYIDHQSCCYESERHLDIFKSSVKLRSFLFDSRSRLVTGNDNV